MNRLGHHRIRPARSKANQEREKLDRLAKSIEEAELSGDAKHVTELRQRRDAILINSIVP